MCCCAVGSAAIDALTHDEFRLCLMHYRYSSRYIRSIAQVGRSGGGRGCATTTPSIHIRYRTMIINPRCSGNK